MFRGVLIAIIMTHLTLLANGVKHPPSQDGANTIVYAKILEKIPASGYIYLRVDQNGTKRWVAIPQALVKVGDTIGYDTRTIIQNFQSKTLGRKFKQIVFANELYLPHSTTPAWSLKGAIDSQETFKLTSKNDQEKLQPFKPKEYYSVEEIHRFRKHLAGKKVKVKGKVYKVSRAIMQRDWVHIGDGSGIESQLTDDFVVTASHTDVKAGDAVEVEATIVIDKDFGYGYFYQVLGENGVFHHL